MAQQVENYETYKRIKLLGEGVVGKAYLVERTSDGTLCVIKQIDMSNMNDQEKKEALTEAKILEILNHPNIITLREVYKTTKGKLCIVMDYADGKQCEYLIHDLIGGDLSAKMKVQNAQPFSEDQILDWFAQICLAVKFIHDRKIIHNDLNVQNIFLTSANTIKLGGFGLAIVLSNTEEDAIAMTGIPYYSSPEFISAKLSYKSDIWSLGVVLYELCALIPPFDMQSPMKIVKGEYAPIPPQYSKEMNNLVEVLLQIEHSKRPTIYDILKNPLIQDRIHNFMSKEGKIENLEKEKDRKED